VIAYESGAADTIDPMAGSYYVETLTDEIEKRATAYIETIDKLGGSVAAIERGFQQREIQQSAYQYQRAVETKDQIVVGVNEFVVGEQDRIEILRIDETIERKQRQRLADLKQRRDNDAVKKALATITTTARSEANLMPAIVDAVRVYATLGEISDAMRVVFGEFDAPVFI